MNRKSYRLSNLPYWKKTLLTALLGFSCGSATITPPLMASFAGQSPSSQYTLFNAESDEPEQPFYSLEDQPKSKEHPAKEEDQIEWILTGEGDEIQIVPIIKERKNDTVTTIQEEDVIDFKPMPLYQNEKKGKPGETSRTAAAPKSATIRSERLIAQASPTPDQDTLPVRTFETEDTQEDSTPANNEAALNFFNALTKPDTTTTTEEQPKEEQKTIYINFNNINILEYIRYISRISGRNFIFNEQDLNFNVSIISEEPTTIENILAALAQELRIHDLLLIEQGNNLIIHRNPTVNGISRVNANGTETLSGKESQLVTQVFSLNTVSPEGAAAIVRPLLSASALVDILPDTNHLIVTDIIPNVQKVGQLLKSIDAPAGGLVIGQYRVTNTFVDSLIPLVQQIMQPIAQNNTLTLVPHNAANTIIVVSTPFLVEKTISVLERLDNTAANTNIFKLEDLKVDRSKFPTIGEEEAGLGGSRWETDREGSRIFRPELGPGAQLNTLFPPRGRWVLDDQGRWRFVLDENAPREQQPGNAPRGNWVLDDQNRWVFRLSPGEVVKPSRVSFGADTTTDLPAGHADKLKFTIMKLQYRNGDQVAEAIRNMGASLTNSGIASEELISSIESIQWIQSSNSLIFTGTDSSIDKLRQLIQQVDTPLRQMFIEMLVLDTTVDDSLTYGADFATRGRNGDWSTAQASLETGSSLNTVLNTASNTSVNPPAASLITNTGYTLGIIGRKLTKDGLVYDSIGALVRAVHGRTDTNILLNPKLLAEDNVTAEIFVGENRQFPTQSIANDTGTIVTQNYEYRDVGTLLRVTPHLGNNNIVTLDIEQEVSNAVPEVFTNSAGQQIVTQSTTIRKNNTKTRVHVPSTYFVVLSGLIRDETRKIVNQVPCLGAIPFLGGVFKNEDSTKSKRNLMIFIRPIIIDTEEEINNLTKHQQDIMRLKRDRTREWEYGTRKALEWLNVEDWCPDCCDPFLNEGY